MQVSKLRHETATTLLTEILRLRYTRGGVSLHKTTLGDDTASRYCGRRIRRSLTLLAGSILLAMPAVMSAQSGGDSLSSRLTPPPISWTADAASSDREVPTTAPHAQTPLGVTRLDRTLEADRPAQRSDGRATARTAGYIAAAILGTAVIVWLLLVHYEP